MPHYESSSTALAVEIYLTPFTNSSATTTGISTEEDDEQVKRGRALLAPSSASSSQVLSFHNVALMNSSSELGLWSLAIVLKGSNVSGEQQNLADVLFKNVVISNMSNALGANHPSPPCFVVDVDLSNEALVCPTIRSSIELIVDGMDAYSVNYDAEEIPDQAQLDRIAKRKDEYSSLSTLKSHLFGDPGDASLPKNNGLNDNYITLIIAVKQSLKKRSTYQEEQALALVMYHLYKFALNTNCILAFVRNPESNVDSTKADDDASVMDLNMFKELVHQLSSGESPRSVSTSGAESKNVEEVSSELDSPSSISSPSLIRPGSIDSDLVENTMLKNA